MCPVPLSLLSAIPLRPQERRHNDIYFFDLDFALLAHAHPTTSRAERRRLPPLPRGTDTNPDHGQHLLLDALSYGGLGQYSNSTRLDYGQQLLLDGLSRL